MQVACLLDVPATEQSVITRAWVLSKSRSQPNPPLEVGWNQTQIWLSVQYFAGVKSVHIADSVVMACRLAGQTQSNSACV